MTDIAQIAILFAIGVLDIIAVAGMVFFLIIILSIGKE